CTASAPRFSIRGEVSSLMAATITFAPWARAASSSSKGKLPFPAIKPSFLGAITCNSLPVRRFMPRRGHLMCIYGILTREKTISMADHLESKNFEPFKKRHHNGYHLPNLAKEQAEEIINDVDPELRPEEQGYVRHYLSYADIMLKRAEDELAAQPETSHDAGKVTEMPRR